MKLFKISRPYIKFKSLMFCLAGLLTVNFSLKVQSEVISNLCGLSVDRSLADRWASKTLVDSKKKELIIQIYIDDLYEAAKTLDSDGPPNTYLTKIMETYVDWFSRHKKDPRIFMSIRLDFDLLKRAKKGVSNY